MWTVLMQTFLMQTVLVHTVLMQTVLMCTYWQGKQIKKKQQQSTSNCKCNANAMPPGQQEGLCERFFDAHQQGTIKNKLKINNNDAGNATITQCHPMPPGKIGINKILKNIFVAHQQGNKLKINNNNQPMMQCQCNNAMLCHPFWILWWALTSGENK